MPPRKRVRRRAPDPVPRRPNDREQLERELAEVQAQYRGLVEHAVEGIFRTSPDGRFLMANDSLAQMLGYENAVQLMRERTDLELTHYVRPGERSRFRRLLEIQGLVHGFEYEAYRRDGSTVWLRDHVRVVRDESGRTVYYEGTVEDITSRKQAEFLLDLRACQQAAVARFGAAAVAGITVAELIDCAASLVAETLDVEYTQILELSRDRRLTRRGGKGWTTDLWDEVYPVDHQSQVGYTVLVGKPVIVHDLNAEQRFRAPRDLVDHQVVSGVTVIIGVAERPYGVLGAHTPQRRSFTSDDVNFMQSVANILAAAIERHRGEEVRRHLLGRAISAQEEERQRVSRELHDETGQALSAILVGLRRIESSANMDDALRLVHELRDLAQLVNDGLTQGRSIEFECRIVRPNGETLQLFNRNVVIKDSDGRPIRLSGTCLDVSGRKQAEENQRLLINELQAAMAEVKTLEGILPICASCKRIRTDGGQWQQVEAYVRDHSDAEFTHGLCPDCAQPDWGVRAT